MFTCVSVVSGVVILISLGEKSVSMVAVVNIGAEGIFAWEDSRVLV